MAPHCLRASIPGPLPMLLAVLLSGCSILSPLPTWELIKAGGSVTSAALTTRPGRAQNTVHHGDAPVRELCIAFNRQAPVPELVPALQAELRLLGVSSRVYEAGIEPASCAHWLRYTASLDWGVPPLGKDYQPFLSSASLSLHRADGRLMASSSYAVDEKFGLSRWARTRDKLAAVVKALLTGFES